MITTPADASELQATFDGLSLAGSKMLSFDILGRLMGLDHLSMLDLYNNVVAPEGAYRKP